MPTYGLTGVMKGEMVLVYDESHQLDDIAEVYHLTKRSADLRGYGTFAIGSGAMTRGNKTYFATRASAEAITVAEAKIAKRDADREIAEEAARQAAYDALPEEFKLARKLEFFCNCHDSKTIAKMPIDTLRAAVQWIEISKFDCE